MSTLSQLREGLHQAWDTVSQGWRELVDRAGDALTRFHPAPARGDVETRNEQLTRGGTRWGLLAAEVRTSGDQIEVAIEVPGMEPEDFELHVVEDVLVVRGEKRFEQTRSEGAYQVMERAYGRFERAVQLPAAVDESGAKASYKRGVLRVQLPRTETTRARRIQVQSP